jgi:uncharacterized membrane protein YkoI
MFYDKALPAAFTATIFISIPVSGMAAQPTPSQIKAFETTPPGNSLSTAIAAAEGSSSGTILDIAYQTQDGKASYRAHMLEHGRVMAVSIDPTDDAVGPWAPVKQGVMPSLKREQAAEKMLKAGATPLMEAVVAAENHTDGKAIDGRLVLREGKPVYAIDVIKSHEATTVLIDPATDKFLS